MGFFTKPSAKVRWSHAFSSGTVQLWRWPHKLLSSWDFWCLNQMVSFTLHTYILYCIAPPWRPFCHTWILKYQVTKQKKKFTDKNIAYKNRLHFNNKVESYDLWINFPAISSQRNAVLYRNHSCLQKVKTSTQNLDTKTQ